MKKAWLPLIALAGVLAPSLAYANASQLPPGEVCFQIATGPVSSGSLQMFYPWHEYTKTDISGPHSDCSKYNANATQ